MAATTKAKITWEKHGDVRVMKANGWIRALVYYEGGWWATGIIEQLSPTKVWFSTSLSKLKRELRTEYRVQFGVRKAAK